MGVEDVGSLVAGETLPRQRTHSPAARPHYRRYEVPVTRCFAFALRPRGKGARSRTGASTRQWLRPGGRGCTSAETSKRPGDFYACILACRFSWNSECIIPSSIGVPLLS